MHILVVDGNEGVPEVFQKLLHSWAYTKVSLAHNIDTALRLLSGPKKHFDVIISGWSFEGADASVIVEATRKHSPPPKIVIMTGYDRDVQEHIIRECNPNKLFTKPHVAEPLREYFATLDHVEQLVMHP